MPASDGYTFDLNDGVTRTPVRYGNRFGIEIAGDLYVPTNASGKLPALAVSGPFGAVKEQASGLYANEFARRGFVALAFDPSFSGESGGEVRDVASPEIYTEDFSATVDFLGLQEIVDRERIGLQAICGLSGMAITAATADSRIKAVATASMYDMSRSISCGHQDSYTPGQRREVIDHYTRTGTLRSVDGLQSIDDVARDLRAAAAACGYEGERTGERDQRKRKGPGHRAGSIPRSVARYTVMPTSKTSLGESLTSSETTSAAARERATPASRDAPWRARVRTTRIASRSRRPTMRSVTYQCCVARAAESETRSPRSCVSCEGPSWRALVTWLSRPVTASTASRPRASATEPATAARRARRRAPARSTPRTAKPAARTKAPPPSAPKRLPAMVTKLRSATPANAAQPTRAASSAAPARAGTSRNVSRRFESP